MIKNNRWRWQRLFSHQPTTKLVILAGVSLLAYVALLQPWVLRTADLPLQEGNVSSQDLRAPRDIEYVSQVLTEEARVEAERAVAPVYAPPDPAIARQQIEKMRSALLYSSNVRADEYASLDQKQADISALDGVQLQSETILALLNLSSQRWDTLQREALGVLEQVMHNPVRGEELETVRQGVPSLVSLSLSESEAEIVAELAAAFVLPNSFYSPDLTTIARQEARDGVQSVMQSYVEGEMIVPRGRVITAADFEALTMLGLVQPQRQAASYYLGSAALIALSSVFAILFFRRFHPALADDLRGLILLSALLLVFLFGARLTIPERTVIPYLYPAAAYALLVSALFGMQSGLVFGLILSIQASFGMSNALDLTPFYIMCSLCGVLALGHARRVSAYLWAGAAVAVAGSAIVIAYRLPFNQLDWIGLATLIGASVLNGVFSTSIALLLQYLLAQFLGRTTALQLLEISRPDFPLLQYFLRRAPGTYQHSLLVANLAEQAAERIGADGLLTRVGALYHDVGKALNPGFFIENQPPSNVNPHDDLDPTVSADIIIRHVVDGLKLGEKYRLPSRIIDFIKEHHGTLITRYQYNRALEGVGSDEDVSKDTFRYPGPKPASRETALLMLADGVEARVRGERPKDDDELRSIARSVIDYRQREGQLDNTPLTQRDLQVVVDTFVTILRGIYHPRLEYPPEKTPGSPTVSTSTAENPIEEKKQS